MKDLNVIKGKFYLRKIIAEGEHENQDFKFSISDARKIARSISAFANNSGGRLLIGVKDNGVIAGVRNEEDVYVVEQAAQLYCRPEQKIRFTAIKADDGAIVIRVDIDPADERPVLVSEPDGTWRAYYRVADENIAASPLMVRAWRRKSDGTPTLFSLSDAEQKLIRALEERDALEVDDIMRGCMMSRRLAEEMIIRLYAMSVIDFRFIDRRFCIVAANPAEQ
ncbi:MAG: ATP-binding protein [Paramuribaculum sp.]|nr:ATP-binding protein [Paramuribaculum sp.]MDE6323901.1 ATP-binding protein [Paramuribaculum sp.]MDE6489468.1 ATP-binding protein [Paramuribaculum sp.]